MEAQSTEDKLDIVLAATERSSVSMQSKISSFAQDFNILQDDHRKLPDRVKDTEQALINIQPSITVNTTQVQDLLE